MKWILLDIEGTVSDKRFVHETLFPFARARMGTFLAAHERNADVAAALAAMRGKMTRPNAGVAEIAAELVRWIDEDRKEEPLKSLQGLIWREGYQSGALVSHIYPDVPPAFARWTKAGVKLAIFSSGSAAAQKLLFAHTSAGNLMPHLSAYFDLSTGPKHESASYTRIAKSLDCAPASVRFYTDAPKEVAAALAAGMNAVLVEREGPIEAPKDWRRIQDFSREQT
ncbi:MAG: acireductone synthase [Alphaproteobacteria bacterium]